jgi:ElaB/YqjD/DUF883 family membrane-anchored ribosome-binding protein
MDQNQGGNTPTGGSMGGATGAGADAADAQGRFAKAKEFVGDKYSVAADAVKNRYSAVRGKVEEIDFNELTENVRGYVRSNPGKALLISVGVGFVIGMLLRRGSDED